LIEDLVVGSRILAQQKIVDGSATSAPATTATRRST